jgi:hypothetical protein
MARSNLIDHASGVQNRPLCRSGNAADWKDAAQAVPRTLQLQNNCTAWIEAFQVECVLADIDADCGDFGWR